MAIRRALARSLLRLAVRPGLAPEKSLARRRRAMERSARLLPLPRGVRRQPAGADDPAGEWWLPAGTAPDSARGALLYLHGGAFVLGSPASHRGIAARLARLAGVPVLVLDYRRAPEHPFPAALEDATAAWARLTAAGTRPVSVVADSAGGWLAVSLALRCAPAGLQAPAALALFSPLLDLAAAEAKGARHGDRMLPPGFLAEGVRAWRGPIPANDPRFHLLAGGLAGLPPLYASFDRDELLADDARQLLRAARAAGVDARDEEAVGLWHAWPLFAGLLPEADATLRRAAALLSPAAGEPR